MAVECGLLAEGAEKSCPFTALHEFESLRLNDPRSSQSWPLSLPLLVRRGVFLARLYLAYSRH